MPNPPHGHDNVANQVTSWAYDAAGNLLNDTYSQYQYDALGRVISSTNGGTTRTNSYNGDGVLVQQDTTHYTQNLATPLSQILADTDDNDRTNHYVYGPPAERLLTQWETSRTW